MYKKEAYANARHVVQPPAAPLKLALKGAESAADRTAVDGGISLRGEVGVPLRIVAPHARRDAADREQQWQQRAANKRWRRITRTLDELLRMLYLTLPLFHGLPLHLLKYVELLHMMATARLLQER